MSDARDHDIRTRLVHAGALKPRHAGALTTPIFQSSTYEYREGDYHDQKYLRLSNSPNHDVLGARLAAMEETGNALVTASGMAAITATSLAFLQSGDHVLAQRGLYGGTHTFFTHELPALGIEVELFDGNRPEELQGMLRDRTRMVYTESITNPCLRIADHERICAFAREHGVLSVIDNTFASPVLFRPHTLGYDIVLHSATKYLNGHTDLVAGVVAGSAEHVERVRHKLNHLGGSLDSHAAFLLERGMKTLALRLAQQTASAMALAEALSGREEVAEVFYPGLASHPEHDRARRLFDGYGGMVSFRVAGGPERAERALHALELAILAPSLGGVETLVLMPARSSHVGMSAQERAECGVTDDLVRVSVGIEDTGDLIRDFEQALAKA